MYSILMVMALNTGAAATPAWDGCHGGGCWGGCQGGYASSCGGCWGGCHGNGGCHGGRHKLFGGGHGLFNKNRGCNGGCWGGGHGCSSGCAMGGCHVASHGCSSGCSYGCSSGCNGGGHRLFGGLFHKNRHGCNGCSNGCSYGGCSYGGCSMMSGCAGYSMPAYGAPVQGAPAPAPTPKAGEKPTSTQAEVTVTLPTEAKLFIDGQATVSTSNTRKFVSPELVAGKEYFYTLRAEIVRDGQTVSLTKEVTVRAGETFQTSFEFPAGQVAAK
jgi:uncharacterized protein (TIGR03000 family)